MTITPLSRCARLARVLPLVVALASIPAIAEVGVILDENPAQTVLTRPYVLGGLTDDPNPVGTVWQALGSAAPGIRRPLNLQGADDGDGRPAIELDPVTRRSIAVWGDRQPTGFDIVLTAFVDSDWTAPVVLGTSAGTADGDDPRPTLAIDPADGSVWVLWWEDPTWPRIVARRAAGDLSAWDPPIQVSAPSEFALNPSAVFHGGVLHVAYEVHNAAVNGTPKHIVRARADGGGFVREVIDASSGTMPNRPEIHSARDRLWVDWIDSAVELAWSYETASGWSAVATEPYESVDDRDLFARGRVRAQVIAIESGGP